MKKLRLDVDALRVESFDTTAAGAGRAGTVRGNAAAARTLEYESCASACGACSYDAACAPSDPWTCAGDPQSCGGTCDAATCAGRLPGELPRDVPPHLRRDVRRRDVRHLPLLHLRRVHHRDARVLLERRAVTWRAARETPPAPRPPSSDRRRSPGVGEPPPSIIPWTEGRR